MVAKPRVLSFKPKKKENRTDLDLKAWSGHPGHHRRAGASSAHQDGRGGWEGLVAGDSCWFWCCSTRLFHQSTGWSLCYRTDSCWQRCQCSLWLLSSQQRAKVTYGAKIRVRCVYDPGVMLVIQILGFDLHCCSKASLQRMQKSQVE